MTVGAPPAGPSALGGAPPAAGCCCWACRNRRAEARLNVGDQGLRVARHHVDLPGRLADHDAALIRQARLRIQNPQMRKPTMPMAARQTPTIVARECVRIGSCSITASFRTSADCIRRSTKLYAWTCDLVVGVEGILGLQLSQSRYGSQDSRPSGGRVGVPRNWQDCSGMSTARGRADSRSSSNEGKRHSGCP